LGGDPVEIHSFLNSNSLVSKHLIDIISFRSPIYSIEEQCYGGILLNSLKKSADLFHFPHYNVPLFFSGHFVVTVHDLVHMLFPEYFGTARAKMASIILKRSLVNAKRIIAVSQATAMDIKKTFPDVAHKVCIVYEYPSEFFNPQPIFDITSFKEKNNLSHYILYVGNRKPHKNIKRLIMAFQLLNHQFPNLQLVIVGKKFTANDEVSILLKSLQNNDIIELDECDDEELRFFYCGAEALILPSLYEGFGLTALEAMACGTPVVVSDVASLPEIVGTAGLYFNPYNTENMAEMIHEILSNKILHDELRAAGLARVKLFTREISARKTFEVYQKALTDMR
jgi:glycosyltransferase involved in cell wall biosynthesis